MAHLCASLLSSSRTQVVNNIQDSISNVNAFHHNITLSHRNPSGYFDKDDGPIMSVICKHGTSTPCELLSDLKNQLEIS